MWDFKAFADRTALIEDSGRSMTYQQLLDEAQRIGAVVPQRSLVFLFCSSRIDSVAGYAAFLENRIVPVLLKADLEPELRAELIRCYRPEYLCLPREMREAFSDLPVVYEMRDYLLLQTDPQAPADQHAMADLHAPADPHAPADAHVPADQHTPADQHAPADLYPELALALSTSGSTGSPKLVRISYRNLAANTASIVEYLNITETERAITTLPMNYTYGLSIINTHLAAGAVICLTEYSMLRSEFWDFFDACGATSFGGVPYTYEILYKMRFTKRRPSSLRYMTQAGGKLSPELHQVFAQYAQETGTKFIVMYGQTEATARMAYLPAELAVKKCGSTGIAIPGGKLWLRDVDGNRIEKSGVVGELVYEGDNVTLGYATRREELCLGDERGGQLETGDMAYYDEDGCFFIVGRLKRFLKIFGNRVNLDETERMLRTAYPDEDLACGGKDDLLKVYLASEDEALKKQIRHFLTEKTGLSALAFRVISVPEIPRSASGKIQYRTLEEAAP